MFYRFFVFLMLAFFMVGCSGGDNSAKGDNSLKEDNSAKGFWISTKGDSIIEFTPSKATLTLSNESHKKFTMDYEPIDASNYRLKSEETKNTLIFSIDKASATLKIDSSENDDTSKNRYLKAPFVSSKDIVGTWYEKDQDGDEENIYIITQREDSYDYETITLNHKEKNFTREIEKDIEFHIENGFIFVDLDTNRESQGDNNYVYYLVSLTKNTMNFIDSEGFKWSEQRLEDPSDVAIPKEYVLVK